MVELAAQIWRDFSVDGDPGSGAHKPVKAEIREWGAWIEDFISSPEFTADVTIAKQFPTLFLDATSSQYASVAFQNNGLTRWLMGQNAASEGGSNSGSNWRLERYNDAGVGIADALVVNRDTGLLTVVSGQIKFPATQNPSADANTLDDYEEGTWTPTFSATGATFSYASQVGTYTKIGNRVLIDYRVELNTSGNTLTGNTLSLTGLPFAGATTVTLMHAASWSAATSSYVSLVGALTSGASSITFGGATAAAVSNITAQNANQVLHATNGSAVRGQFHYRTA